MRAGKSTWFWNILIVIAVMVCALAFVAHYKNWIKIENDRMEILSGIFYRQMKFSEIENVSMVPKIPPMERITGFSAWQHEKGVFRDSLAMGKKVHVYVDNLAHPKIKLELKDSLKVFLNFADSTETDKMYRFLAEKIKLARQSAPGNE